MGTTKFWREALERAAKSAGQAALGLFIGDAAFDVWQADWKKAAGVALGGFVLSLVTSVATAKVGEENSPMAVTKY